MCAVPRAALDNSDPMGRRQVDRSKVKQVTHTDVVNEVVYLGILNIQHTTFTHFESCTNTHG